MHAAEHQQKFEEALASSNPFQSLCDLASALRDEGVSQMDLYLLFESQMEKNESNEKRYDAIVDTLDEISGGPWAKGGGFFSTVLVEDDIRRRKGLPLLAEDPTLPRPLPKKNEEA